jgi:hypothetical protein
MRGIGPFAIGPDLCLRLVGDEDAAIVTDIRNRHREWFLDNRRIDVESSRQWLRSCVESNVLLAISTVHTGKILGTIGWVDIGGTLSVEIGRIVVDYDLALAAGIAGRDCRAIAWRACMCAGNYVIYDRHRDAIYTRNKVTAHSASRLAQRCGLFRLTEVSHLPADWQMPDLCVWRNTREEWLGHAHG